LADGQVDRREVPSVGTIEEDFGVRAIATGFLVDAALGTLDRSVKFDVGVQGTFTQPGRNL